MVKCSKKGCDGFGVLTFTCRQIHWMGNRSASDLFRPRLHFGPVFVWEFLAVWIKFCFFSMVAESIHVLCFSKSMDTRTCKKATRVKVKELIQLQYSSVKLHIFAINETKHLLVILQKWKQPCLWGTKTICLLNTIQFYISSNNSTLVRLWLRR